MVGETRTGDDQLRAFLYTPSSGMIDISTLNGAYFSATSINNLGQVVGYYMASSAVWHSFLVNVGTPVPPTPTAQVQELISDVGALVSKLKLSRTTRDLNPKSH